MDVKRLLKFIMQELALLLLLQQLFLEDVDLLLEIGDASGLALRDEQLSLELSDLLSDVLDIVESILVVDLTLLEHGSLDFNFFVEKCQLLRPLDQLSTQDISLVDDHFVIFSLLLLFSFGF